MIVCFNTKQNINHMKKLITLVTFAFAGTFTGLKAQTASLQVIHNCADAAATTVDVYAGSTLLIDNLQFRFASQTFTNIPANTNIVVGIAPATSTSSSQSIATFTVNFAPNSRNIVVADGIVSPTGYSPSNTVTPFTLNTFTAGLAAAPNATTTSILVHHGSTDAPVVDIVAPFTGTNPVIPNILVNNAPYGAFAGYLNLPTTNYKIQVRDQYNSNVVAEYLAPLSTLNLGGSALAVVASGFLNPTVNSNGPAFGLYVATVTGGSLIPLPTSTISSTRLQAIHNCADALATNVDVYFRSATTGSAAVLLIDNFAFRSASPYIDVPVAETVTLSVAPATSTNVSQAIANFTYNLSANNKYQLIASGIVSPLGYSPNSTAAPFNLIANANVREKSLNMTTNTDVLVFHGATDAPAVNVVTSSGSTVVANMAYGTFNSAGYLQLPSNTAAGNYTLHITNVPGTSTVASYVAPLNTLGTTGNALTVLASGFLTPANNSNGPAFGLWAALPTGGNLIQLPSLTTTSIKELSQAVEVVKLFPNPAETMISVGITAANDELTVINIYNLEGKLVKQSSQILSNGVNSVMINIDELNSGAYFVTAIHGNMIEKGKFIKK